MIEYPVLRRKCHLIAVGIASYTVNLFIKMDILLSSTLIWTSHVDEIRMLGHGVYTAAHCLLSSDMLHFVYFNLLQYIIPPQPYVTVLLYYSAQELSI